MQTINYGDIEVPLLKRDWKLTPERVPYSRTDLLTPGQRWQDAPTSHTLWESYVCLPEGSIPVGAVIARELKAEGATISVWTDCFRRSNCVIVSHDLVCLPRDGELGALLDQLYAANRNRWAGLPDAIAIFPDGRVAMREAKVFKKDRVSPTQHAFAHVARQVLGGRLDLSVIEWGYEVAQQS